MFDSCEVFGTFCSGLMSVMLMNELLLVFASCEVLGTLCSGLMSVMFINNCLLCLTAVRCLVHFVQT